MSPLITAVIANFLLSGCVYFNTFFNAQKAYDQAMRMHDKRLEKNPEDSVLVTPEEKLKLERCIAKSSKVLELFPDKLEYQPKAIFLIGESFMAEGEYSKAILKYEELQRFYPNSKEMVVADFHHAKCLLLNGQYPAARAALEKVSTNSPNMEFRQQALSYLAQLEVKNNSPAVALDIYEKLLKDQAHTPEARANVHFEAAKLAFDLKQWERARGHARAQEIKFLPTKLRYRCDMLAAECLFHLDKAQEGIAELEIMQKNRLYGASSPEIKLKLAEGYFLIGKPDKAVELLKRIPLDAPKTAFSAEAFFRLGEYHLRDLKDEKQAKIFYDSAAAAGSQYEYGALAAERSMALGRLTDLRKPADTTAAPTHYRDFMIAELFLFRLDNIDSALGHLDRIVKDPRQDSTHTMRAAYARAFIQDEFKKSKPTSDSLYRYVLEKYPNTEYAKQAERNLGLKPTVKTDEDNAHQLFLAAEALRFGGSPLDSVVIPAYAKVVSAYPKTREAGKAEFVIAVLYEGRIHGEEKVAGSLDSAVAAFQIVRANYPQTPYYAIAEAKLQAAGIKPKQVAPPKPGAAAPAPGAPVNPNTATPATPSTAAPSAAPDVRSGHGHHAPPEEEMEGGETPAPPPAAADTSNYQEGNQKEEIDKGYENVDQY